MNRLLFLAPLATVALILIGMKFFGPDGLDWLITDSMVIIATTIFASNFINFYRQNQNALDLAFAILFFIVVAGFLLGVVLSHDYFWLFIDVYMIIINILGAIRFFVITRRG